MPGNPTDDAAGLGLFGRPSRDDCSTDAWTRPPPVTPALVSVDGRGPGPETTPGDRHDDRGTHAPDNTLAAMFPYYASHVSPLDPTAQAPLAYAGPWSSGPLPAGIFPATTRTAPAPPRTPSRADDRAQSLGRAHEWANCTLTRGSTRVRARALRTGPVPVPRPTSAPPPSAGPEQLVHPARLDRLVVLIGSASSSWDRQSSTRLPIWRKLCAE